MGSLLWAAAGVALLLALRKRSSPPPVNRLSSPRTPDSHPGYPDVGSRWRRDSMSGPITLRVDQIDPDHGFIYLRDDARGRTLGTTKQGFDRELRSGTLQAI